MHSCLHNQSNTGDGGRRLPHHLWCCPRSMSWLNGFQPQPFARWSSSLSRRRRCTNDKLASQQQLSAQLWADKEAQNNRDRAQPHHQMLSLSLSLTHTHTHTHTYSGEEMSTRRVERRKRQTYEFVGLVLLHQDVECLFHDFIHQMGNSAVLVHLHIAQVLFLNLRHCTAHLIGVQCCLQSRYPQRPFKTHTHTHAQRERERDTNWISTHILDHTTLRDSDADT